MSEIIDYLKKLTGSPVYGRMWGWTKGHRRALACLCLISLLTSALSLAVTQFTRYIIDSATAKQAGEAVIFAVLLITAVMLQRLLKWAYDRLNVKENSRLLKEIRFETLRLVTRKKYSSLEGRHSGELVNRTLSDASQVVSGLMSIIPDILSILATLIGASVILILMDWRFLIFLAAGGIAMMLLIGFFKVRVRTLHRSMMEAEDEMHAGVQETMENLRVIKASGSEERRLSLAGIRFGKFETAQNARGIFTANMNLAIGVIFQAGWLFAMIWGCVGLYHGTLTYGMLAAVLQLVNMVQQPIARMASVMASAFTTASSAERIFELRDLPDEFENTEVLTSEELKKWTRISAKNITFGYKEEKDILNDFSFELNRGEFCAVTGPSGIGKSTMFSLLLGIYTTDKGKLTMQTSEREYPLGSGRRKLFAYVPQGNTLFSGTIRENLTLFSGETKDENIKKALETACIDKFVYSLPEGTDTVIGERGIGLSEGQAQRIAIARALLSDAEILLLDESTSALDEETEAAFLKNLEQLKEKACFIVTHRKAALEICGKTINIE